MVRNIKEDSKLKALAYCGLRELPEVEDKEHFWLRAVALVKKVDGSENYVYVEKDLSTLEPRMIKDFGAIAMVHETVEYYPYSYLKEQYMPKFKTAKKEERIKYLTTYDKSVDFSEYTLKELDKEVMRRAARKQMDVEKRGEKKY
jgi:hypothetical protein